MPSAIEELDKLTGRRGALYYQELGEWVINHISAIRAALAPIDLTKLSHEIFLETRSIMYEMNWDRDISVKQNELTIKMLSKRGMLRSVDDLSDDERVALFKQYCTHCGTKDPRCQCWNDE